MSIPSIVYKAHATGNDFVVYLDAEARTSLPPMKCDSCATVISVSVAMA